MKGYKEKKKLGVVKIFVLAELIGIALSLVTAAVLAVLIVRGMLSESAGLYASHGIRTLGAFLTALIAGKLVGSRYAPVCAAAAGVYMLILFGITVLLFDSRFDTVVIGLIFSLLGAAFACVICMMQKGRGTKRKRVL